MKAAEEWALRLRVWFERLRDRGSFIRHDLVGPPQNWREQRRFQIEFLRRSGLRPHHSLVDIGCGTLRGGLPIVDYLATGGYVGIDVRTNVLAEAQHELERAGLQNKQPTLLQCSDFTECSCGRTFDFAWAFAVLIHMTDDVCTACLQWAARHLSPTGTLYADVLLGERRQTMGHGMGAPFPIIRRPLADYRQMASSVGLQLEDMGTLAALGSRLKLPPGRLRNMLRLTHSI